MNGKPVGVRDAGRYSVLASIMLGSIMGPIDASVVNVILPTLTEFFSVHISTAQWVPMIYLLTISSLLLFYGRLGDIVGYKKVYLSGLAGFIIASGLCGLSPTIHWLILFRALQGLAAGMMMAVPYAIIARSFPPAERGKALGINAISISAGLAVGPSLGGIITSLLGWRFAFLINIPIGIIGLLWARHVIPELKGQPGKMDILGTMTAFVSLFSFLLFVNRFQSLGLSYATGIMLLVAALAGICFLQAERRVIEPMLDLSLFRNITFSFANISALLNFMSQYVMVFLTPFYLQRVLHYPPNNLGLIMTSFPLAVMAVAPFSGTLSDRIGTRVPACSGATTCAVSLFFMSQLPASASSVDVVWRLVLFGLGTGIFQSPNNILMKGDMGWV
jgi:EmrB/QacA subfamily drug resistance transporter